MKGTSHVCIATLGSQPQVVTLALDALLAQALPIQEVLLVHLSLQNRRYQSAFQRLSQEFADDCYGDHPCRYRHIPVQHGLQAVNDLDHETAIDAVNNTFQTLFQQFKQQGRTIHLCVTGGRRLLGMLAMSTAMLYFDHSDRIWHVFSTDAVREQTNLGRVMHLPNHAGVRLVPIRVPAWGHMFPSLRSVSDTNVDTVIERQTTVLDVTEQTRCQQVYNQLTPRQRETLRAFASGLSLHEVADRLSIEVTTVNTYKTRIFQECRIAWELAPEKSLDYHWLRDTFVGFFSV